MLPDRQLAPVAVRAGVYTRISSDPSGQRAGVERQRADCEEYCLARGWRVAELFEDNDYSASTGKRRPGYERILAAVECRRVDAIVTWHNDRLHRSPKELEVFIDLVERTGVRLAVVTGGDYYLTTPDGRLSARIVGAVARKASEDRSRRVRRKHLELAEQGRAAGQLGWGERTDEEREVVREAAARVLAGHGLTNIARDWNRRGVPGRRGTVDSAHSPAGIALVSDGRATRARRRSEREDARRATPGHLGRSPRPPDVGPGAFRAFEPRAQHERPHADEVPAYRVGPLRHLREPAVGSAADDHTKRYVCAGNRPGHQLAIVAKQVDELVAEHVLELLTAPSFREALLAQAGETDGASLGRTLADLAAAQTRLQGLDDDFYVRGSLAEGGYRSLRAKLEREIDLLHVSARDATKRRIALDPDPHAFWTVADFQQRRELVRLVVARVEVMPERPGVGAL